MNLVLSSLTLSNIHFDNSLPSIYGYILNEVCKSKFHLHFSFFPCTPLLSPVGYSAAINTDAPLTTLTHACYMSTLFQSAWFLATSKEWTPLIWNTPLRIPPRILYSDNTVRSNSMQQSLKSWQSLSCSINFVFLCGAWRLITVFTNARQWTISWGRLIQCRHPLRRFLPKLLVRMYDDWETKALIVNSYKRNNKSALTSLYPR
jgi:hypothetical protein